MKAKLIAEPAIYWHGDQILLHRMIDFAAAAQCDMFKYQCFNPERLSPAFQPKKKFYSQCQLSDKDLAEVADHVENNGMEFVVTVNTPDRLKLLQKLNVSNVKVASGQIHPALINAINLYKWKRVFVSTGMLDDPDRLNLIKTIGNASEVVVMHAVSLYPHNDNETNMLRLNTLRECLGEGVSYGYSDHTMDDLAIVIAVAIGAQYIERHFKIDGCFGPTHHVCASPNELAQTSTTLRRMESIMGDGSVEMQKREHASWNHYKNRFLL